MTRFVGASRLDEAVNESPYTQRQVKNQKTSNYNQKVVVQLIPEQQISYSPEHHQTRRAREQKSSLKCTTKTAKRIPDYMSTNLTVI